MQLHFIRHAQSQNNALWANTGSDKGRSEDPELTEIGLQQAKYLANYLAQGDPIDKKSNGSPGRNGFGITHIYSSYMVRAVKTGMLIAGQIGVPLSGWEETHERGGIYLADELTGETECLPGKDRGYFTENYPEFVLPEAFPDTGWWNRRPQETPEECIRRARRFLNTLLERHGTRDDRVAVISHGGFYNDFLRTLLGCEDREGIWYTLYNAAITRIDFHEDLVELVYQNRFDFLPRELIT